jgi:two-component system LytT family response regulator
MINCVIIEDEPLAVKKLENYISKLPILNIVNTFNSAVSAIEFLILNPVDLIFLDIEMKEFSGIQLLESLNTRSKVIITTAHDKYAIKGFEFHVSDYLLKPIAFERFVKAIEKVSRDLAPEAGNGHRKIFVKTEYRLQGIDTSEVLYMGDYRRIVLGQKKIMTLQTFKEIMDLLPVDKFVRVHNSFIVAIDKIEKIERNRITIAEKIIPVSVSYGKDFYSRLNR